jgi:hypothetical protein
MGPFLPIKMYYIAKCHQFSVEKNINGLQKHKKAHRKAPEK